MSHQDVSTVRSSRIRVADHREPVTIVIPCCNEEEAIPGLRCAITKMEAELSSEYNLQFIVVDDGSTDNTNLNLRIEFANWDNLTIIEHDSNRGIAAAIATGIANADSEIVASMDFDCSYDPTQFGNLLPLLCDDVDVVTASPYHPDGTVASIPRWRLALSRLASHLYEVILGQELHTYTSCFRVYRRSSVLGLDLRHQGFAGVAELIWRLRQRGGRIVECPADLDIRQFGQSKMRVIGTAWSHFRLLIQAALFRLSGRTADERHYEPEQVDARV